MVKGSGESLLAVGQDPSMFKGGSNKTIIGVGGTLTGFYITG